MLNTRAALWAVVASVAAAAGPTGVTAWAAATGPGSGNAVLGQPLDFSVQLRIDGSEALSAECITAEVGGSERRLPAAQVRTSFEVLGADMLRVRVVTSVGLDEPVISVLVHVGCQNRSTRQFVVLADPPVLPAQLPMAAASPIFVPAIATAPLAPAGPVDGAGNGSAGKVTTSRSEPARAPLRALAAPVQAANQRRVERTLAAKAPQPSSAARAMVRTAALRVSPATPTAPAAAPAARLKLDAAETSSSTAEAAAVEQAIEVLSQAVVAARAAASAAAVAEQRIVLLEKSMQQMQAEAKASRELAVQLAVKLNQADGSRWMVPLMTLLGGLLALSSWLTWRLFARPGSRTRRDAWKAPVRPDLSEPPAAEPVEGREATAPIPFVTAALPAAGGARAMSSRPTPLGPIASFASSTSSTSFAPTAQPPSAPRHTASPNPAPSRPAAKPAWPPAAPARREAVDLPAADDASPAELQATRSPTAFERTLPASSLNDLGAARDVSIEELIDLEQQAEFFVVLGQDDSAIDLLMEHLRSTGGGSPLPYLKLLEIYHRLGDRTAFERTRARFNQRFNAYAPEWEVGLQHGRSIEAYAGVVPRLQQVWARPLDAMAELEALLFRKSRGDLFDLPAYREVLFLYSLARDLLDRESASSGSVDLLLPLASGGDFSSTAPYAYLGSDGADLEDRPTAPVDLDLTASDKPPSIFDPFDEKPQNSRR